MADPFTAAELAELRARYEQGRVFGSSLTTELRLLATLDAQRTATYDVLYDMRKRGILTLDREKWRRYVPDDENQLSVAYTAFAVLMPDEVEEHYAAHPDARERDVATARRLAAEYGLTTRASDG